MESISSIFRKLLVLDLLFSLLFFVLVPIGDMNRNNQLQRIPQQYNEGSFQPSIVSVDRIPLEVEYFHDVNVSVMVQNASNIAQVTLHFRINIGNWQTQAMINTSSNTFWTIIPQQAWRNHVEYYINATDLGGLVTIDDNATRYYSYTVVDTIPPNIQIFRPYPGEHFIGVVTYDMDFSDLGSDVDYNELYLNGELYGHGTADGFTGSGLLPDGAYTLWVLVNDCAGNRADAQVRFSVENPFVIPVLVLEVMAIGSVIVICLIVGVFLFSKKQ
ncbi:MAG: hypothetical protein ACFFCH_04665 [Promethearchaeota archaeon]